MMTNDDGKTKKHHLRWMLHRGAISGIGLDGIEPLGRGKYREPYTDKKTILDGSSTADITMAGCTLFWDTESALVCFRSPSSAF